MSYSPSMHTFSSLIILYLEIMMHLFIWSFVLLIFLPVAFFQLLSFFLWGDLLITKASHFDLMEMIEIFF